MKLRKVIAKFFLIPILLLTFGVEASAQTLSNSSSSNNAIKEIEIQDSNTTFTPRSSSEYIIRTYNESGVATVRSDSPKLGVYKDPLSNVAYDYYYPGESVSYNQVVVTNKFVYVSWRNSYFSGRRYMPVKNVETGRRYADCK